MGVRLLARRFTAPVALALVLALSGSTAPSWPAGSDRSLGADGASDAPFLAPASVTSVEAQQDPSAVATPQAAVRIGAAGTVAHPLAAADVPDVLLRAYRAAADGAPSSCHLPVSLLAAIGEVESGSLVAAQLDARHRTSILGPVLDGRGFAAVPDTDGGRLDGNATWDRAMGPMQFIPSTWRVFGVDGDGDGETDPQDVEDAAAATAAFLCYGGRDLATPDALRSAILAYNHSTAYQRLVLTYQQRYAKLGLDQGMPVSSLPTSLSLVATPLTTFDQGIPATGKAQRTPKKRAAATRTPSAGGGKATQTAHPTPSGTGTPSGTPAGSPTKPTSHPTGGHAGTPTSSPTDPATDPETPCPTPTETVEPSATETAGTDPDGTDVLTCPPCTPVEDPSTEPTATPTADPDGTGTDPVTCDTEGTDQSGVTGASPSTGP